MRFDLSGRLSLKRDKIFGNLIVLAQDYGTHIC